jgi:hypothetical protein
MRSGNSTLLLGAALSVEVVISGCSSGSAALLPSDCRPGDKTMTCCIKKFPADPVGACGATASDIETALRMASQADEDDFANNASLPEWKQWCIKFYVRCVHHGWTGQCDDCLRYCEGQQDWPTDQCFPRKKKR